jgi:C-methyltransferase C-terminal domain/Methyltransferase domain/Putative zinc binding domain
MHGKQLEPKPITFQQDMVVRREKCRICGASLANELIAFDDLPVAGVYVSPEDLPPDPVFPLTLTQCAACGLVQLRESVVPSFYNRYSFISGVATGYKNYLRLLGKHLADKLTQGSGVLEIGCSDGTLLQFLRDTGFSAAGFEPATGPANAAREKGLSVANEFFNAESASRSGFEAADLVIVRHVLEHIDEFPAIFAGIDRLAQPETTLVIEVPDLTSTIERSIFSNIYHIHACYFDVATMSDLLERYGWQTVGSTTVDIFGGSLLLWARRKGMAGGPAFSFQEVACQPTRAATLSELNSFAIKWKETARTVREFFDGLRNQGMLVAGYGAAERTTSLMGTSGLDASHISAIYDRNPHLIGRALPGSRIPILHPDAISEHNPEYLVIFAQSFEDEIIRQQTAFRETGGRFISLKSGCPRILTN